MKSAPFGLSLLALFTVAMPIVSHAAGPAPTSYRLVRKISLPGEDGWDYLTVDSRARRLYISRSTHVTVLNVDTGQVVGEIPDLAGVHGVAIDPRSGHGFTSNGRSNSVTIFDLKTLKKLDEVSVGQGPDAILFDPTTRRVFTLNGRDGSATAIDAATGKVVGAVTLPGRPEFAVADGKGHLYNNIEDKSEIVEIDAKALKVLNTWSLAPGEGPSGLAMDTKSRRLFSVCDNGKMVILDADHGRVVATPAIGNGPDAGAFDSGLHRVYSSNGEDGTLTVLQETAPDRDEPLATVPTQPGARTMALDEKTHHVFTVSATVQPPTPGTEAPRRGRRYVAGSFVVLEYAPGS